MTFLLKFKCFSRVADFSGDGRRGDHHRAHQNRASGRTSLTSFEVSIAGTGAQFSSPINLSGFIAKHIEHPAFLHSKPASLKILSKPFSSHILDFSKIEARKLELEMLDFDLPTTVEDVVELFAPKAHEKDLETLCLVDANVPLSLRGDSGRLRQILSNLVGNAVKFTDRGEIAVHVFLVGADRERRGCASKSAIRASASLGTDSGPFSFLLRR